MIKLLFILLIVLAAYWVGRQSVFTGRKKAKDRASEDGADVIDIDPED